MNRSRVTGDLTASGLLYADIANDRVGIGSTIPGNKLSLPDSAKIGLGNAEDLTLLHDGTNSIIKNTTGNLFVYGTNAKIGLKIEPDAKVRLYYNGSAKFETSNTGATVTGGLNLSGELLNNDHIQIQADSKHLIIGAGDDLRAYHNGTNSIVNNNTGTLFVQSDNITFKDKDDGDVHAKFIHDGAVELYHDNAKKLETISTGIKVLGSEGGNAEIEIFGDEGDDNNDKWKLMTNANANFYLQNYGAGSWQNSILARPTGATELYNTGNLKLATTTTGVTVTGTLTATSFVGGLPITNGADNRVITASSASAIQGESGLTFDGTNLDIDSDSGHLRIGDDQDLDLYHNGSNGYLKNSTGQQLYRSGTHTFENAAGSTEYLRITSDGKLGIGVNSPSTAMHLKASDAYFTMQASSSSGNAGILFKDSGGTQNSVILYDFDDDYLKITTNNDTERLRITSTGLGIGIVPSSSEGSELAVKGTDGATNIALVPNANTEFSQISFYNAAYNSQQGYIKYNNDDNSLQFRVNLSERLRITSAGKLGLGITTPDSLLHIHAGSAGSIAASSAANLTIESSDGSYNVLQFLSPNTANQQIRFGDPQDNGAGYINYDHDNSRLTIGVNGPEKLRIDSSGRVLIGTTTEGYSSGDDLTIATSGHTGMTIRSGTTHEGAIYFSDATSGAAEYIASLVYSHNTNSMMVTTNGSERFRIDSAGNVGIGTDNPNHELTVYGDEPNFRLTHTGSTNKFNALYTHVDGTGVEFNSYQDVTTTRRPFIFKQYTTEVLRIDSTGALGLGITPKNNSGNYRQLQIGLGAHFYGRTDDTPIYLVSNGYRDGSDWKYTANTTASQISMGTNIVFSNAASGTAGNAISFSERLRIAADGKATFNNKVQVTSLGVGTVPDDHMGLHILQANPRILIKSSGTNAAKIFFGDSSSTDPGVIEYSHSANTMYFGTNNNGNRLAIDSSGRISFFGLDPANYYATYDDFVWGRTSGSVGMTIVSGNDSAGYITWADGTSSADQYRGRLFYSHNDNSFNFRCNGLGNNILSLNSSSATVTGTTDGVLNLDTSSSSGTFIRFKQGGTTKNWIGCATGLGGYGDTDDLTLLATDNIILATNSAKRIQIQNNGNTDILANSVHLYNSVDTSNTYFIAQNTGAGNAGIRMKNNQGDFVIIANDRLRFYDLENSSERLSIDSNGNIGVNCVSPTNISNSRGITIKGASGSNAGFINFMDSGDNSDARILANDGELHIHADPSDNTGSSEIVFHIDNTAIARLSGSNLLVGTHTSGDDFHLKRTSGAVINTIETTAAGGEALYKLLGKSSGGSTRTLMLRTDSGADAHRIITPDNVPIQIMTQNSTRLEVTGTGYVNRPNQPAFKASGNLTFTDWNSYEYCTWATENYDNASAWNGYSFTCPTGAAGDYLFQVEFLGPGSNSGNQKYILFALFIGTQGQNYWRQSWSDNTNRQDPFSGMVLQLAVGDVVRVAFHKSYGRPYASGYTSISGCKIN